MLISKASKYKDLFLISIIIIVAFFAFSPCLKNDFIQWDDYSYVVENQAIRSFSLYNIKRIFTSFFISNYHPLTMMSYSLDYYFYKLNPYGYHLTNLMLHLLNCLLVFWLFSIFVKNRGIAFITAILFAIHPLHVESVAWIGERKDVLYGLFFLGALVSYCYYLKDNLRPKFYHIALLLFFLSLMSKSMAVTLPLVLFLIDYISHRKIDKAAITDKIPFFLLSLLFGILAMFAMGLDKDVPNRLYINLLVKFVAAGHSIVFYISKILIPAGLSCLYVWYEKTSPFYSLIIPILIISLIAFRRSRVIIFGLSFFIITLLPVLKFIPFAGGSMVADRYAYIPSIGIFFIVGEGFMWLYETRVKYIRHIRIFLIVFFAILIISLSLLTYHRCNIWQNTLSLWDDALQKHQYSLLAYNNRGMAYLETGDTDKAISDLTNALKIDPRSTTVLNNRAAAYGKKGEFVNALSDLDKSVKIAPKNTKTYFIRGIIYMQKNEPEHALAEFNKSVELNPGYSEALLKRAMIYFYMKKYEKSWDDLQRIEKLGAGEIIDPAFRENVKKMLKIRPS